jgi:hypothetical protein
MDTLQEFNTVEELRQHLSTTYRYLIAEIKFEHGGYDNRIDWNFYYVLAKLKNSETFHVAGMSDGYFGEAIPDKRPQTFELKFV